MELPILNNGFRQVADFRGREKFVRTRIDLSELFERTSATTEAAENSSRWSGVKLKSTFVAASANSLSRSSREIPASAASSGEISNPLLRFQSDNVKPSIGASNCVKSIFIKDNFSGIVCCISRCTNRRVDLLHPARFFGAAKFGLVATFSKVASSHLSVEAYVCLLHMPLEFRTNQ